MRPETRLDSAVFQLTPTRTRCDLVIIANGKTEKLASGLLNPFLAHLKTAQNQIAKGGYSIALEPNPRVDAAWFTKNTVERFVRFVSTPEVLERVNTIEAEILQLEEAITIQGNGNLGLCTVEDHQPKSIECIEGSQLTFDANAENAIVLYKPGARTPESNGSTMQEENSKVQLLRVLETRKTMLQKEQGMAFARAVAAGFDMDHMAHLISFSECFGASRLMEACMKFMELWRAKHDTGQWLEIEAAETMSMRPEFSTVNTSGIILSGDTKNQTEYRETWPVSNGDLGSESNGMAADHVGGEMGSPHPISDHDRDRRLPADPQAPLGPHEYFQGQFQHTMFPQWPVHSPPGAPVFQPYPIQGMPYYQNYPGSVPFFPPPYPPMEDPRSNVHQRMGPKKRHSMDSKDSNVRSDTSESQDGVDPNVSELEKEIARSHKKVGRSGKKNPDMVVIRNINYMTSKKHNASGSESPSASDSESEGKNEDLHSNAPDGKHRNSSMYSKSKESHTKFTETSNLHDKEETMYGQEAESGNWQAFQSFLLRNEESKSIVDSATLSGEKEATVKRRQNQFVADPILLPDRDSGSVPDQRMLQLDTANVKASRMNKQRASDEERFHASEGRALRHGQLQVQFREIEGGGGRYRRATGDDFMIYGREQPYTSDPLAEDVYGRAGDFAKGSSQNVIDESFVVPFRSGSQEQVGIDSRSDFDMGLAFPSALQRTDDSSCRLNTKLRYEPDDLSMMPERGKEMETGGYDPAMDYDMEVRVEVPVTLVNGNQKDGSVSIKGQLKKLDKETKSRSLREGLDKRKMDVTLRTGKPSKLNPLAEAQARAEKLRAFKANLQKEKKEKEEEEIRRLEALKRERQKRIAAKGSSSAAQAPLTSQQNRSRLPTKLSPGSHKGSKFSDSEPGSSSPLQKMPRKRTSIGSSDSQQTTWSSRLNSSTQLAQNGLSRSVSSLPELKKESNDEQKETSIRTKRLSDFKGISVHHASLLKSVSSDQAPKKNSSAPKSSIRCASSAKSVISDKLARQNLSDEPQIKKISAIMNLDKSKSATLPEIRIKTVRVPPDTVHMKSTSKETEQKQNGSKSPQGSESIKVRKNNEKGPQLSSGYNNMVIEKKVVVLEHETVPVPVAKPSQVMIETRDGSYKGVTGKKSEVASEYAAICTPSPSISIDEIEKNTNKLQLDQQPYTYEVATDYSMNGSQKLSSSTTTDKPYQAPYARATSLEDPCTTSIEWTETSPVISSETARTGTETIKTRVWNFAESSSIGRIHETQKPGVREPSKGLRKLLKLGRKTPNSASGERNLESDSSSIDDHTVSVSNSGEVSTLKNLISQEDTHVGGTPPKVSRPFSLLSPFRSKTSEKKLTVR